MAARMAVWTAARMVASTAVPLENMKADLKVGSLAES
jgi:hypothetical protein